MLWGAHEGTVGHGMDVKALPANWLTMWVPPFQLQTQIGVEISPLLSVSGQVLPGNQNAAWFLCLGESKSLPGHFWGMWALVENHRSPSSELPLFQCKRLVLLSVGLTAAEGDWNCCACFCANKDRLYTIFLLCIDFIRLKSDGSGIFVRALCALFCCLVLIKRGIVLDVL